MIPEGWQDSAISELAEVDPEALSSATDLSEEIDYISLEDVSRGRLLGSTRLAFADAPSRARRVIRKGDVLFGTVRPNLQSHLYFKGGFRRPIASTGFAVVRAMRENDPGFIFFSLMSDRTQTQVDRIIAGSNYPAVSSRDVRTLIVLVPPPKEQRVIADALSDVDALVESLDALVAKKQEMKQAAMQQLLTGRTRLPGHTDKWTEIDYNELTWHRAGNGSLIKGKVYQESGADRIPAFSASGQDVWCDVAEYTEPGLVISAVGSRCGKVFRASGAWTAIANTHVLFAKEDICSTDFLWLRVNEEKFWVKGGTGQPFVLVRESLKRRELWPNRDEQVQIAQVLMDMDAEIDALVAQREKAELLKQGMMQELLSGRVRLV